MLYIIPAFLCGLVLVALLEVTKSVLAPIIAHGAYNSLCLYVSYSNNGIPIEIPRFPEALTSGDSLLIGLAAMWIAFIILPPLTRK